MMSRYVCLRQLWSYRPKGEILTVGLPAAGCRRRVAEHEYDEHEARRNEQSPYPVDPAILLMAREILVNAEETEYDTQRRCTGRNEIQCTPSGAREACAVRHAMEM